VIIEECLSGSEPTIVREVRFGSAVKCKKGPQVLTSLLNQRRNDVVIIIIKIFAGCMKEVQTLNLRKRHIIRIVATLLQICVRYEAVG